MRITRRDGLRGALALGAVALVPLPLSATPLHPEVSRFTGGGVPGEGGVVLSLPETSEDAANVALSIVAQGAEEILLVAPGNPDPRIARLRFGPLAGHSGLVTRIRLARSQIVIAVARMPDGSFRQAAATVEVMEGACHA